jgi:hypothetical protein
MKTFQEFIIEAGDYWDPDPEKDKKLPGKGPQKVRMANIVPDDRGDKPK